MVSFKLEILEYNNNHENKDNFKVKHKLDLANAQYNIYLDDTLRDLKTKIAYYLLEKNIKISIDEIYVYYTSEDIYNAYKAETQLIEKNIADGKVIMNKERIKILNDNIEGNNDDSTNFTLTNNAIKSWDYPNKKIHYLKSLTIYPLDKFNTYDYTFCVNPFKLTQLNKKDGVELKNSSKNVTARNTERLIDCNFIKDKDETVVLRVVLLEDAFKYIETNDSIDNTEFIKLYYPYFKKHNIYTSEKLKEIRDVLISELPNSDDYIWKYYSVIELLNNNKDKTNNKSFETLVRSINLTIKNKYTMKLPMESIFNNIHANHEIEAIKYNPGYKREPIYRIYSHCLNKNGEKQPHIGKRSIVNSLQSSITNDEIGMIIKPINNETFENLLLIFNNEGETVINGKYNISSNFKEDFTIHSDETKNSFNKLLKTIKDIARPKIDNINDFLELTGYEIEGFNDDDIDIFNLNNIDLVYCIKIKNKITNTEFKKYSLPFESIFSFERFDINKDGVIARFKRVNNYREPSMDEEIVELLDKNEDDNIIKDYIKNKYKLTDINAIQEIERIKGDEMYNTVKNKKQGFKVKFKQIKIDKDYFLEVNVENVNSFEYFKILETYIKSFSSHLSQTNNELEKLGNILKGHIIDIEQKYDVEDEDFIDSISSNFDLKDANDFGDFIENHKDVSVESDFDIDVDEEDDKEEDPKKQESYDFDDLEEEGEGEEEEEEEVTGGNDKDDTLTSQDVKKYFDSRKRKMANHVFGDIAYSRTCLNNQDKQPMPINDEEYNKIKDTQVTYKIKRQSKENEDEKQEIKIKKDKSKDDLYYVCPRYWDISSNEMITQDDFNEKYTDKEKDKVLIPKDKTGKIPKGAHIYQFYDKIVHKSKDDKGYFNTVPYWTAEEVLNIDGSSYGPFPCCGEYKKDDNKKKKEIKSEINNYYVTDYESIKRLKPKQLGFLPPSIEKLFEIKKEKITKKENRHELKNGVDTVLRLGGNKSKNQSFISCIANIYNHSNNSNEHLKKQILEFITIDNYIYFNRGMLFSMFLPDDLNNINITNYENSSIYKEFIGNSNSNKELNNKITTFFKMLIASYENFINYFKDDNSIIDHTLIVDILLGRYSTESIFERFGNKIDNIIIFEIDDNDELNILCPINTNVEFKKDGSSIMLLKRGNLYENLCNRNKKFNFNENKNVMEKINSIVNELMKCKSRNKDSKIRPPLLSNNIKKIIGNNFSIHYQMLNNQFLTVGVVLRKKQGHNAGDNYIYIPCSNEPPISINGEVVVDHIDSSIEHVQDFKTTINRYEELKNEGLEISLNQVLSKDEKIYGFLTNTLQFVKINPSIERKIIETEYPEWTDKILKIGQYYSADRISTIAQEYNDETHKNIQNVRLETTYYNVFRSILRNIISNEGITIKRKEVEELKEFLGLKDNDETIEKTEITKPTDADKSKAKHILEQLMKDRIYFIKENYEKPRRYTDITSCIRNNIDVVHCNDEKLIIPDMNLNNNNITNSEFYYNKIIDELIRFPQVRKFIMEPNRYLNVSSDTIKINKDEIIMLETVMRETLPNTIKTNDYECNNIRVPYKYAVPQKI